MNLMTETIDIWYRNGFIDKASGMIMLNDLNDNPTNIPHNIIDKYASELLERAKKGDFETYSSDQIKLAISLNQQKGNQENDGVSGVNNPQSESGGRDKGGDPTKPSKGVLGRNPLNKEKARK